MNKDFEIDRYSGIITINRRLNRELTPKYDLIISVQDQGDPPLSSKTSLEITVLDENDNAPVFSKSSYFASISENMPIGTSFLQV